MTLRAYLIVMTFATLIAWGIFGFVLFNINPLITNWIGFSFFYVSLFLALLGSAALIGFLVRFVILKKELAFRLVAEAFRQSFLFSLFVVASLLLLSKDLFSWLNLLLLIISLSVLEYFLISYGKE